MKKIVDHLHIDRYVSKTFNMYFKNKSFAVFDIETTGLSPAYCKVILSGILLAEGDECQVIQFFADQVGDEKEILQQTVDILKSVDYIITYNGRHFDIPFMEKRARKHKIDFDICPYNLDLYLIVNGHSELKTVLPNLKQKSIEIFMGLASGRDDEISGKESVDLYHRYMTTKSFDLERQILLHNHDDLIQLYRILPIISKVNFHKAMFKLGFVAGNVLIQRVNMAGRDLHVFGSQLKSPIDYISFPTEDTPFSITMDSTSRDVELIVPGQAEAGAIYFDAQAILGENVKEIEKYPSVTNGYLIAEEYGKIHHMEINAFLLSFFER